MYCVIGLGNLGEQRSKSRHNSGFQAVDRLAEKMGLAFDRNECEGISCHHFINGEEIIFCKPQTSLNESGVCVAAIAEKFKIPIEKIIILYDDMALPVGEIRVRAKGGPGTHNGMRSIISHLNGANNFPRVRIGIGRPAPGETAVSHVLGIPDEEEGQAMDKAYEKAADAVVLIITETVDSAQNKYNIKGKTRNNKSEEN